MPAERPSWRGLSAYFDVAKITSGALLRNLLRGLFKLLIAALFSPQALGVARSIYSFFKLVASLVDWGLDATLVTFVSAARRNGDSARATATLSSILAIKLLTIVMALVLGNLLAPLLASRLFSDPSLTIFIRLVFVAVGGQLLWGYLSSYLASDQRFNKLAVFLVSVPVLMWIATGLLLALGQLTLGAVILIHIFPPLAAALLWWPAIVGSLRPKIDGSLSRELLRFSRWLYLSRLASTNRNHLNPILLKNAQLSGSVEAGELNVGLYSFGNDMASEITVLSQSLMTVMLPKATSKTEPGELIEFVKRSYKHLALLILPLALLVFAAEPALLLLGRLWENYLAYLPSIDAFRILYLSSLFTIASIPMQTALYAANYPQLETSLQLSTSVLLVIGSIVMIPIAGYQGAAWVVFAQRFVTFSLMVWLGSRKLRALRDASSAHAG